MFCKFYVSFKIASVSEGAEIWKTWKMEILTSEQNKKVSSLEPPMKRATLIGL